jgi:membrane associated rhomboid family serine protease
LPFVTLVVVALVLLGFLLGWARGELHRPRAGLAMGATVVGLVEEGESSRILSGAFVHSNAPHVANNAVFLLLFGRVVEGVLGGPLLAALVVLSGVVANLYLVWIASPHPVFLGQGASAMGFAMIGSTCLAWLARSRRLSSIQRSWPVAIACTLFAIAALFPATPDTIPRRMHGLGFMVGVCFTALFLLVSASGTASMRGRWMVRSTGAVAAGLLAVALCAAWTVPSQQSESARLRSLVWGLDARTDAELANELAWDVATAPAVEPEELQLAWRLASRARSLEDAVEYRDTLATVLHRMGDSAAALTLVRPAVRGREDIFLASQYARFADRHLGRHGVLREGVPEAAQVDLRAGSGSGISLTASGLPPRTVVDALIRDERGQLIWLLVIETRAGGALERAFPLDGVDLPSGARIDVVRLAVQEGSAPGDGVRVAYWRLDPEVLALP